MRDATDDGGPIALQIGDLYALETRNWIGIRPPEDHVACGRACAFGYLIGIILGKRFKINSAYATDVDVHASRVVAALSIRNLVGERVNRALAILQIVKFMVRIICERAIRIDCKLGT